MKAKMVIHIFLELFNQDFHNYKRIFHKLCSIFMLIGPYSRLISDLSIVKIRINCFACTDLSVSYKLKIKKKY